MYENAPPKTASYNYPEYSNVLFGDMSYHQKSASMHQVWEQNKDVTKLIGAKYNRDYDSAFEEFSGLMNKTASLGDSLSEKLAMFHSLKYTPEELISSLSKTAHLGTTEKNVIKTVMSKFASNELVDPNVRYMYDLSDDLSELRQQLSSFVKTASRLPEAESKFRSIEENRNLLIRVGKVEI
jgi:hypothetical protein